jgi:hypothetical protein
VGWLLIHHGVGEVEWPKLLAERLPEGARVIEDWSKRTLRDHVDAMFQVGAHARGGSPTFMSHTIIPGLRLRLAGELLSESHWWAWTGAVPVLGIVGSNGLGSELGSLGEVPFLAVQRSSGRDHAEPILGTPAQTAEAIEAFAARAAADAPTGPSATPAGPIRLEASLGVGDAMPAVMRDAGWSRTSRTEFVIEADAWRTDDERVDDAIQAAIEAGWPPYAFVFDGLDPTSRETALAFPPERLARSDAMVRGWAAERTPLWFDPSQADRPLEGLRLT